MPLPVLQSQIVDGTQSLADGNLMLQSVGFSATSAGSTILVWWASRIAVTNCWTDTPVVTDNRGNLYTILSLGTAGDNTGTNVDVIAGLAVCINAIPNVGTITVQMTAHTGGSPSSFNFGLGVAFAEVAAGGAGATIHFDCQATSKLTGNCISPNAHDSCSLTPLQSTILNSSGSPFTVQYCNVGSNRAGAIVDLFHGTGTDTYFGWQNGYAGSETSGFVPDPSSFLNVFYGLPVGSSISFTEQIAAGPPNSYLEVLTGITASSVSAQQPNMFVVT